LFYDSNSETIQKPIQPRKITVAVKANGGKIKPNIRPNALAQIPIIEAIIMSAFVMMLFPLRTCRLWHGKYHAPIVPILAFLKIFFICFINQ
jgi:hypothetical protein